MRNLILARSAIVPFFVLSAVLVFLWARRDFGDIAGLMAVTLFTTLPTVLAFASMAYTDIPTGCMQLAAFFGFAKWLEMPTKRSSIWLGIIVGLALLSKMTTVLYFPAAAVGMFLCKWWLFGEHRNAFATDSTRKTLSGLAIAFVFAVGVLWGGYGFSVGHVQESMQVTPDSLPSFQHFPRPVRGIARAMIVEDWLIPAPALLKGVATIWSLNGSAPPAYLLGRTKNGGWWYFFLLGIAVKLPLPFLLLSVAGLIVTLRFGRQKKWTSALPAACALAVLAVTLPVKYNAGTRHVMVVFPLLAIVAASGASWLWHLTGNWRPWRRLAITILLLWQAASSLSAGTDFISYFNQLAGHDPSRILVSGCDLDCGQDLFRLSQALHQRDIAHFSIAIWSSADLSRTDLPPFNLLQPFKPTTGWVAVSMRALREGDVFHSTYSPGAFLWLERYRPVAQVGKTILLYYIPDSETQGRE
jgi:4-amino-4-deoxy-L-arabinose transferase-like glycosyltransferase